MDNKEFLVELDIWHQKMGDLLGNAEDLCHKFNVKYSIDDLISSYLDFYINLGGKK